MSEVEPSPRRQAAGARIVRADDNRPKGDLGWGTWTRSATLNQRRFLPHVSAFGKVPKLFLGVLVKPGTSE